MTEPINKNEPTAFEKFLASAHRGKRFIYFVGTTVTEISGRRNAIAQQAFEAYEQGKVLLMQQRVPNSDSLFNYIAQKR